MHSRQVSSTDPCARILHANFRRAFFDLLKENFGLLFLALAPEGVSQIILSNRIVRRFLERLAIHLFCFGVSPASGQAPAEIYCDPRVGSASCKGAFVKSLFVRPITTARKASEPKANHGEGDQRCTNTPELNRQVNCATEEKNQEPNAR